MASSLVEKSVTENNLTHLTKHGILFTMKSERIKTLKKSFHREWLLIAIDQFDETTTTPISGKLIAHSPHRDEIYQHLMDNPPRTKKVLIEYSEDSFPKGYAAAFLIYA